MEATKQLSETNLISLARYIFRKQGLLADASLCVNVLFTTRASASHAYTTTIVASIHYIYIYIYAYTSNA